MTRERRGEVEGEGEGESEGEAARCPASHSTFREGTGHYLETGDAFSRSV